MSKPQWEKAEFAEIEVYLERARELRRQEMLREIEDAWARLARRVAGFARGLRPARRAA
jgi:hypothetical protein